MKEVKGHIRTLRAVSDEELLGRSPVDLSDAEVGRSIAGNTVLVTGAAGSIGSELCRQIGRHRPAAIVGFDIAETPLFDLDQEMRTAFPHIAFHAAIGNIQSRVRVDELLRKFRPSTCYHAAAYKHVPLMEEHIFEAIENNVIGTANVAHSAAEHGVRDFVLISTDKAVRPTSMMGAAKRIAELLLGLLNVDETRYISVRFGNVLGSTGSVLPIFRKQLVAGGPLKVTHPEMRRFFMTIAEACQLVLKASTVASHGQICVLDMGCQIKIVDLAHALIRLSGLEPERDIRVEFTGMRPGEKLYEELSTLLQDTVPTPDEHIRILVDKAASAPAVPERLEALYEACKSRDATRLVHAVCDLVPDYTPDEHLQVRATACDK